MANGKSLTKGSFRNLWALVEKRTVGPGRELGTTTHFGRTNVCTVSLDFTCHPHQLRHTYATRLFELGSLDIKQVQYLLGHSSPEMTLRVYTHYRSKSREAETAGQVRDALHDLA